MRTMRLSALLVCALQTLTVEAIGALPRLDAWSHKPAVSRRQADEAPPYRDDLVSFHQSLVEISSISGNETAVGEFLIEYLTGRGFSAERQVLPATNSSAPERFNVIAWPGSRSNSSQVLVTTHIDVVPPYIPYSRSGPDPPTAETVFAGRGTVDAKGSLAAQVAAVEALVSDGSIAGGNDVMLAFVVGEEVNGAGMLHFSRATTARPKAAIFGEPTEGTLACGHKGVLGCYITANGISGHSGYPWTGKSANEVLVRALYEALGTDFGTTDRFGNTTMNIGVMEGGTAANVIPDLAQAVVVLRLGVGPELTGHEKVKAQLTDILTDVDDEAFEMECTVGYGAVEASCNVDGFETAIMNYGTDMPNFKLNATKYLYGPGSILVAHSADEAITLGDMEQAVEDYKTLILHALGS